MTKKQLQILLGAAALTSMAAEPAFADGLTANGQFTSNYVLRGISQSAKRPALQGGVDYDTGVGVTLGTWVSSLDFGDNTPLEWDIYGAYNFMLGPLNASVGGIGYIYPDSGAFGSYNYFEFTGTLAYDFKVAQWSAKVFGDPFNLPAGFVDILGVHPKHEYWMTTGLSVPISPWLSVSGNVGLEAYSGAGTTNYAEWDLGFTITYDKYSLDIRYFDTSEQAVSGPYFATGPFGVATLTFRFP